MNDVYFRCMQCHEYLDAGGRLAIVKLVNTNIISNEGENAPINVQKVLSCTEYIGNSKITQDFLSRHISHNVIFTALDDMFDSDDWLDLLPIGNVLDYDLKPRSFVEKLGMKSWTDVETFMKSSDNPPLWTENLIMMEKAKNKFNQLLQSK